MTKAPHLTQLEEIELIRQLRDSERGTRRYKRALDTLVEKNLGLVHKVVGKFPMRNASCTYDDLFQEGIAGLIHGIEKFDVTRGYRLSTYSYRWIRAYVQRYFQNHGRTVRVPVYMSDKQCRLNKDVESLTRSLGRTPTDEEIKEMIPDAESIRYSMMTNVSLNDFLNDDTERESVALGVDKTDEVDTSLDVDLMLESLKKSVPSRDYDILVSRYGLDGEPPATLQEISQRVGVSRARCHQVCKTLISHLRREYEVHGGLS